jgi:hypothetical protein
MGPDLEPHSPYIYVGNSRSSQWQCVSPLSYRDGYRSSRDSPFLCWITSVVPRRDGTADPVSELSVNDLQEPIDVDLKAFTKLLKFAGTVKVESAMFWCVLLTADSGAPLFASPIFHRQPLQFRFRMLRYLLTRTHVRLPLVWHLWTPI